jgi:hypothetical protein
LGHQSSDRKMAEIATITDIGRTFAHYWRGWVRIPSHCVAGVLHVCTHMLNAEWKIKANDIITTSGAWLLTTRRADGFITTSPFIETLTELRKFSSHGIDINWKKDEAGF